MWDTLSMIGKSPFPHVQKKIIQNPYIKIMNTPSENAYYEVMTSKRINIVITEKRDFEFDFLVTDKIIEQYNVWRIDHMENTETEPTPWEMVDYLKKACEMYVGGNQSGFNHKLVNFTQKLIDPKNDD